MEEIRFKSVFFRLYDKKIASGEVTFSQLNLSKTDFIRVCTEDNFVLERETILKISSAMNLTDEEERELLEAAERQQ